MKISSYTLIRSKRKTLALQIDKQGVLIVRAPKCLSVIQIEKFIEQKSAWIIKKQSEIITRTRDFEPKNFEEGELFLYLGEPHTLQFNSDVDGVRRCDQYLALPTSSKPKAEKQIVAWYKQQAFNVFTDRVAYFAEQYNFDYKVVAISSAKTRWGSCTGDDKIRLAWRLVMAPLEIIDAVVVHELCHTIHKNHSKQFWDLVLEIFPQYKKCNAWLKEHGASLRLS
jgi:predicted metal-dependent hydrolase